MRSEDYDRFRRLPQDLCYGHQEIRGPQVRSVLPIITVLYEMPAMSPSPIQVAIGIRTPRAVRGSQDYDISKSLTANTSSTAIAVKR